MSDRRVDFFRHSLGEEELASLARTIGTPFLTLGPRVAELEAALAAHLGVPHVVGVSSCSTALFLSLKGLGVEPGDEVITTPMTFVATPNAILHAGATPIFVDVDPATGLLDPAAVEAAITPRTRGIIAVHLYGQLSDMPALRAIADRHHLFLVEDAAHAIESRRGPHRSSQLGDATAFSFYATKEITCGDGGAIAVHDGALADRLRRLRNHGQTTDASARHGKAYRHWDMVLLGYKAVLSDVQAALLLPQVARLKPQRDARRALVERYERAIAARSGFELIATTGESAHHLFPVLAPAGLRDAVLEGLGERGIGCAVNYRSIHTLTYYRERFGFHRDALPRSAALGERVLSLPLYAGLPPADVDVVVAALFESLEAARAR